MRDEFRWTGKNKGKSNDGWIGSMPNTGGTLIIGFSLVYSL